MNENDMRLEPQDRADIFAALMALEGSLAIQPDLGSTRFINDRFREIGYEPLTVDRIAALKQRFISSVAP